MSWLAADGKWLAQLRAGTDVPPRRPRVPLWWGTVRIGSIEPEIQKRIGLQPASAVGYLLQKMEQEGLQGWQVQGDDLTASLAEMALALRDAGLAHAWRDEQLAVTDGSGLAIGSIERAAVRPLGITTFAVHLTGCTSRGHHWVQQRSLTKPNDPGLWDTLMGGMVPARDSVTQALERETWEEAGLRLDQITRLAHGGRITTRRPAGPGADPGYVVEHIDWYRCEVPDGVVPANQDGEVEQFCLLTPAEVREKLLAGQFTLEAALILAAASGA